MSELILNQPKHYHTNIKLKILTANPDTTPVFEKDVIC